ncbi:DUF2092 domain-containing protein [Candidatus Sumerlaeota bacterium]|nr:DUF2092 domain-containing protein [Candidatus Sumerlaeota bacterium]
MKIAVIWAAAIFALMGSAEAAPAGVNPAGSGTGTPAAESQPDAAAILKKTIDFYGGLKSVSVTSTTLMKIEMQGMKTDMNMKSSILAQTPNKFYSKGQADGMMAMMMGNTMISDGKKFYVYMPQSKSYTEEDAPAGFSGLLGQPGGTGGEAFLLAWLGGKDEHASLLEGLKNPKYIGEEEIEGVKCHKIQAESSGGGASLQGLGPLAGMPQVTLDIYIDAGAQPIIRMISPDMSKVLGMVGESMGGGKPVDEDAKKCQENLTKLDGAKEQWALENNKKPGDVPVMGDLVKDDGSGYLKEVPVCPSGKKYIVNPIGKDPVCLSGLEGHSLEAVGGGGDGSGAGGIDPQMSAMFKDLKMQMQIKYTDWKFDPELPGDAFAFVPPEGSKKVASIFEGMGMGQPGAGPPAGAGDDTASPPADDDPTGLVGQAAPAMKLPLLGGGEFNLADQKGKKVVILDFWATWCGPCSRAMPEIISVAGEFKDKDVVLIAVNQEEKPATVQSFMKEQKLDVKVGLDLDGAAGTAYRAGSIPETVIIGKDGVVHKVHVGYSPRLKSELRDALNELTAK